MENTKDLNYYKNNCEEDYIKTPISVLRYITELEQALQLLQPDVIKSVCSDENLQCNDYKTACEKCLNAFYEYKKQTVL
jgi:hypothetical protein